MFLSCFLRVSPVFLRRNSGSAAVIQQRCGGSAAGKREEIGPFNISLGRRSAIFQISLLSLSPNEVIYTLYPAPFPRFGDIDGLYGRSLGRDQRQHRQHRAPHRARLYGSRELALDRRRKRPQRVGLCRGPQHDSGRLQHTRVLRQRLAARRQALQQTRREHLEDLHRAQQRRLHRDARHTQRDGEELSLAALRPRALVARQRMGADGENQRGAAEGIPGESKLRRPSGPSLRYRQREQQRGERPLPDEHLVRQVGAQQTGRPHGLHPLGCLPHAGH